ncbi:MAG: polysaccharide deacetylase [Oscillospiraceae bacterium]|nr:polysaccharide deacetylase [Oscillospiraceae bacterium]
MARQRRKKERGVVGRVLLLYALMLAAALLIELDGRHVRFTLSGGAETVIAVGSAYTDPGCSAVSDGRLFGVRGGPIPVKATGAVDAGTPGEYVIDYEASLGTHVYHTQRTVRVADLTAPVIRLERREGYTPSWFDGYEEEGYSASDNYDGDLTDRVRRSEYDDCVVYEVSDAAGNETVVMRQIPYVPGRPVITLAGGEATEIPLSLMPYADPGWRAADAAGNDMSAYVRVEGEVDTGRCGVYERSYRIDSGRGEAVCVTRQVSVVPATLPETVIPGEKTIYLTFDDGPGPYTDELLDVLAEYGVKASFFVTCRYPAYFDAVGRAYREGHSVCVHTASHNYYQIYSGEEAYLEDFKACEEMIREQTGGYTTLFRFPGGSSNTVSSFNKGIMTRLTADMNARGYQYFDWNVDSDDAGRTRSTAGVYRNIINGCSGRTACVVLQHDVKDYSVAAVRSVIEWGLENGYVFRALDMTSPTAHHPVAN